MGKLKLFLMFAVCLVLSSCTQCQQRKILLLQSTVEHYDDKPEITPSPKEDKELTNGFSYGLYKNRDCNGSEMEENLIRQYTTYVKSLFLGDEEACRRYVYKDAIRYHKEMFPSASDEDIWNCYFEGLSTARELYYMTSRIGMEIEVVIPRMIVKVSHGDETFIKFQSSIQLYNKDYYFHQEKLEDCLAYFHRLGKRWEFVTINDDTEGILSFKCDKELIDTLINSGR